MVLPGSITEIVGRLSSGRTSLRAACLGEVTGRGAVAALVDADSALDPASVARAGVDLARLLWVRCGGRPGGAPRAAEPPRRPPGPGAGGPARAPCPGAGGTGGRTCACSARARPARPARRRSGSAREPF